MLKPAQESGRVGEKASLCLKFPEGSGLIAVLGTVCGIYKARSSAAARATSGTLLN